MRIGISALGQLSEDTGGRTYIINFIRSCIEMKLPHEYFIFYSGPKEDVWGELPPNFHKITVPFSHGSSWAKGFGLQFVMPFCLIGKKLDVIYFTNNFASIFCWKPYVVAVRSTLYYHFPWEIPPIKRFYRKTVSRLSVRFARKILVPSASIARDVVRFMGTSPEKITVVPHGVETDRFAKRPAEMQIDARLADMGLRRPYFLFVSALWHYKGADKFISALKLMRERTGRTDIVGAIAGKGLGAEQSFRQIQQLVEKHGMHDVVHFLGQRPYEDMPYLYWGAEALVFPSRYESFGNPLVEAMAAGTPIIASNCHAIPEIVGLTAVLIDPDQIEDIARAMERMNRDPGFREQLIAAGRERARRYSWKKSVKSAQEMIESVSKPKILLFGYLPPPYFGPSVTYQALMKSEFSQRFDVTFVDITVAGSVADLERFRIAKLFRVFGILLRVCGLMATRRFDFCCCPVSVNRNAFLKDGLLLQMARLFRVPTVLYAHGNNLPDFHKRSSPSVKKFIDRTFRNATAAVVLGERLRFNFEAWLSPEKIFVVPTGIEPLDGIPEPAERTSVTTVLYLGNLIREKGVFVLLEAARIVAAKRGDVRFVFGGAWFLAEDERAAKEFVARNELKEIVEFAGPVAGAKKWRLVFSSDILAFPTFYYYETMGLVLLEAMQAGLPVVTTRRGSIPEVIQDGVNGWLVEEQDPEGLAGKILELADDPALRQKMGQANRTRFQSYYTHEQYGQRMAEVFEMLAQGKAGNPK
jgi:glycosyltransferase involved in cell wall biosynthesis